MRSVNFRTFSFVIVTIFLLTIFQTYSGSTAIAVEDTLPVISMNPSASATDSYILFWPLTAGRTQGDSIYSLKLLKEQIRGWFIFGDVRKADYAVFLGTKRVLEAEKLLRDGNNNSAIKTLDSAKVQFTSAYDFIKNADSKGRLTPEGIRRDRLLNLKTLIDGLKVSSETEIKNKLDSVQESIDAILRDYLG